MTETFGKIAGAVAAEEIDAGLAEAADRHVADRNSALGHARQVACKADAVARVCCEATANQVEIGDREVSRVVDGNAGLVPGIDGRRSVAVRAHRDGADVLAVERQVTVKCGAPFKQDPVTRLELHAVDMIDRSPGRRG